MAKIKVTKGSTSAKERSTGTRSSASPDRESRRSSSTGKLATIRLGKSTSSLAKYRNTGKQSGCRPRDTQSVRRSSGSRSTQRGSRTTGNSSGSRSEDRGNDNSREGSRGRPTGEKPTMVCVAIGGFVCLILFALIAVASNSKKRRVVRYDTSRPRRTTTSRYPRRTARSNKRFDELGGRTMAQYCKDNPTEATKARKSRMANASKYAGRR